MRYCCLIISGLAIASVALSCGRDKPRDVPMMDIINCDTPLEVTMADLVDSIHYVALETSDESILGSILSAVDAGECYVVKDERNLYTFDKQGNFISRVGHEGRADNEYIYIDTYFVDHGRKLIGVVCNYQRKISYYTFDGEFRYNLRLDADDAAIRTATVLDDGSIIASYPLANDALHPESQYRLLTEQPGGRAVSKELMPGSGISSGQMLYSPIFAPVARLDSECYMLSPYSQILYSYRNGSVEPYCAIPYSKETPDDKFFNDRIGEDMFDLREQISNGGMSSGITAIYTDGEYLFAMIDYRDILLWDGSRGILLDGKIFDPTTDTYELGTCGGWSDENMGCIDAEAICRMRDSGILKHEGLQRIASNMKEDDNPVIYRRYFKSNLIDLLDAKL